MGTISEFAKRTHAEVASEMFRLHREGERLTPRIAYDRGVTRLAARILDIKKAGYAVRSDYDAGAKCAVYWMEKT